MTDTSPNTNNADTSINIMLVDDSSVIRGALSRLLEDEPKIKIVASVANGDLGVRSAASKKPDIVILDIEMPVMDGITALPLILEKSPSSKVIMFSALTEEGADITLKALSLGAVECLVKPSAGEARPGGEFQKKLLDIIRNLAQDHAKTPIEINQANKTQSTQQNTPAVSNEVIKLRKNPNDFTGKPDIVAIGSSTGGPQALFEVIRGCGNLDVPIVLTQHMPATFTKILAKHIGEQSNVPCVEGEDGMVLEKGKMYVAPGGFHMVFQKRSEQEIIIKLDNGPLVNYCKPAVDTMFESLLKIYDRKILGVILTGMGHDGLSSCESLVEKGARVIAQDEKTSIVWGMPGAVAKAGVCTAVLPLNEIGPWIKKAVQG